MLTKVPAKRFILFAVDHRDNVIRRCERTARPYSRHVFDCWTRSVANAFLNRSEDRIETIANPFRPAHSQAIGTWPVGGHFLRALDAPVAAALASMGRIKLDLPQIRCIKEMGRRHPRWFREGFAAALEEK